MSSVYNSFGSDAMGDDDLDGVQAERDAELDEQSSHPDRYEERRKRQRIHNRNYAARYPEKVAESKRKWEKANPTHKLERQRKARLANPQKEHARRKVYWAVKRGTLIRPATCGNCGASARIEAHHSDYNRPLDVQWLCHACHAKQHRLADEWAEQPYRTAAEILLMALEQVAYPPELAICQSCEHGDHEAHLAATYHCDCPCHGEPRAHVGLHTCWECGRDWISGKEYIEHICERRMRCK